MRPLHATLFVLWLAACDYSDDHAVAHLRGIGYDKVACERDGRGVAVCVADGARFRCVTTDPSGCQPKTVACERFYLESPKP